MNHVVTKLPEAYKQTVDVGLQGTVVQVSYPVNNYINPERKLVTNQIINSSQAGRDTMKGEEIQKQCNVYLPSGYDVKDTTTQYNVL